MILIVGLGNPGKDYESMRHNIGFIVLDKFAEILIRKTQYHKFNSSVIGSYYDEKKIVLLKPLTFMNNSGIAVSAVYKYFDKNIESILIIHDDLDIDFGEIRLKLGGGTGGHNGLESIVRSLGELEFDRLRFGIGRPPGRKSASKFVLTNFKKSETSDVEINVLRAVDAIKDYITCGIQYCMNKYN
jgi:PTH1 family peptidyl-tRNA hydrolase